MSELDKLTKYDDELQTIAEFGEWLSANGYTIRKIDDEYAVVNTDKLAWQWLGIDAAKVEQERRQLLKVAAQAAEEAKE